MKEREYQSDARRAIHNEWASVQSTLVQLPTGTGKTILAAGIVRDRFPGRTLFIAHREELIFQAAKKIEAVTGFSVGIEMGDYRVDTNGLLKAPTVVIATVQTLTAGGDGGGRLGKFDPAHFSTVIADECHHSVSASWKRVIRYFAQNEKCKILGITATSDRADEESLGQIFETCAYDYEILDAIHNGWLVPILQQMVSVTDLDFSQVRTTAGDLNGADLARVMEAEKVCQEIAGASLDIIGRKRALVFTSSVRHAEMTANIFNRHREGMAEWVCGKTDKQDRRKTLANFASGKTQVVCNCGVLTEGFDDPGVEVIIMGRPTKSRSLYSQMVGRSTRPLPGIVDGPPTPEERRDAIAASAKPSCLVVDFTGNAGKHKLMTSADILGGKVSDEAIAAAVSIARKSGKAVDMREVLDEEEDKIKTAKLEEEARKARLVAKAKYSMQHVNPFDVLAITPAKPRGWDEGKTLTEKQRGLLQKQGINPDSIPFAQARQLIAEIFRRWKENLCSFKQAKVLKKFGFDTEVSWDQAKQIIDGLAARGWRRQ